MLNQYIMGIDGGGTYTRVLITDNLGKTIAHIKYNAGASIHKNPNAINDVQNAIIQTITKANLQPSDISVLVMGIAGYDKESDLDWINHFTQIENFNPHVIALNDAKIAHASILLGKPGIICIAGTGSIILGLNEQGQYIRNYDFYHNAYAASRLISYNFVQHVLANHYDNTDKDIISKLITHFNAKDLKDLAILGSHGFENNSVLRDKLFGDFTKEITTAATLQSQLSKKVCDEAVQNIITGIELVASCFSSETIQIGLIGSVANCPYIKNGIIEHLPSRFILQETPYSSEQGAILIGMKDLNIEITPTILNNLKKKV